MRVGLQRGQFMLINIAYNLTCTDFLPCLFVNKLYIYLSIYLGLGLLVVTFKPEFTIEIFTHYKPRIAVATACSE